MLEEILPKSFYTRNPVGVAKDLLGKIVVRNIKGTRISGVIVEVEAYNGKNDPASHASRKLTVKNKLLFEDPGRAYIYFIYGNYWCFNIVAHSIGDAGGVLIRALEPLEGVNIMMKNRKIENITKLCNGPGKLAKALLITGKLNGIDVTKRGALYIAKGKPVNTNDIVSTPRIGVKVGLDKQWRFYIKNNPYISKGKIYSNLKQQ